MNRSLEARSIPVGNPFVLGLLEGRVGDHVVGHAEGPYDELGGDEPEIRRGEWGWNGGGLGRARLAVLRGMRVDEAEEQLARFLDRMQNQRRLARLTAPAPGSVDMNCWN